MLLHIAIEQITTTDHQNFSLLSIILELYKARSMSSEQDDKWLVSALMMDIYSKDSKVAKDFRWTPFQRLVIKERVEVYDSNIFYKILKYFIMLS